MPENTPAFEPRRFRTTVPYYSRYRLNYPERLIRRVADFVRIKAGDAVMDLGCGPGLLAIAFAKLGMKVVAIDPEPDMLAAAEEAAREAGATIEFRQGSSFDLPQAIGPFRLVTMGRSFHWMDRAATLEILDRLIAPGGGIALFNDNHPRTAENRWRKALNDLGNEYGRRETSHVKERESGEYQTHEPFLLRSRFNRLESAGIFMERKLSADDIVGLAFSLSTSAPQRLGGRKDAFERDLRAKLRELSPDGQFAEIAEAYALIATRSGDITETGSGS